MFVAVPTSKAFELNEIFHKHQAIFNFKEEKIFYPHLSVEAFPNFHHLLHPCEVNLENDSTQTCENESEIDDDDEIFSVASVSRKFLSFARQFGLVVYRVEVKRKTL